VDEGHARYRASSFFKHHCARRQDAGSPPSRLREMPMEERHIQQCSRQAAKGSKTERTPGMLLYDVALTRGEDQPDLRNQRTLIPPG